MDAVGAAASGEALNQQQLDSTEQQELLQQPQPEDWQQPCADHQGLPHAVTSGDASMQPSRAPRGQRGELLQCQVESCKADLSELREYHQRYKICEFHLKVSLW